MLLQGDLGTGKTTLVRAAARALGVAGPVTSPTFTLAQRYRGRVRVVHVDGYRLGGAGLDEEELGLLLGGPEEAEAAVTFVEWPEALEGWLPEARVALCMSHLGGDGRLLRFRATEPAIRLQLAHLVDDLRARHRHPEPEPGASSGG